MKKNVSSKTEKAEESAEQIDQSVINIQEIKDSVLDHPMHVASTDGFKFSFAFEGEEQNPKMDFQSAKDLFEKEFIVCALKVNRGRINQTALKANIPKKTLLRKIEKYEINPKEYY